MTSWDIIVSEDDWPQPYEVVQQVSARHHGNVFDPGTPEDVNMLLRERAAKLHANAVINVTYVATSRGRRAEGILAEGTAIVFDCTCDDSPGRS
jgi:hypothetical protein